MRKCVKIIGIIVVSLVLVYVLFIVEESVRLSHNTQVIPLIILEEYVGIDEHVYKSIGFRLNVKQCTYNINSNNLYLCGGKEFWLFDKFLIWGWIS